jgi:serine/threonine-protein kinase
MSEQSPKQYVALLDRSGLAPRERIVAELSELRRREGPALTVDNISAHFIKANLITTWHDEKLRAGKYRGFFLGKYKLLGFLGSGGMCSVYLAEHTILRQPRAIKVLPRSRVADKSYLERFYVEGRAAATLSHPNIVRVYDIDNDGENHFLVMEYVEGIDLYELVKKNGPIPIRQAADFILQAAIGLQHAHDAKLVHRDVKPANLLVTKGDKGNVVKVLDLGLALLQEDDHSVTMAHNERVLGTADYLAPEQAINSHEVDHRADIYGLGCSLYYLLTGQPPFPEGSLAQRIAAHQSKEPVSIAELRPDCPKQLLEICQAMMQKDRRVRIQECRDVAKRLRALLDQPAGKQAGAGKPLEKRATNGAGSSGSSKSPVAVAVAAAASPKSPNPGRPAAVSPVRKGLSAHVPQPPNRQRAAQPAAPSAATKSTNPQAELPFSVNGAVGASINLSADALSAIPTPRTRRRKKANLLQQIILAGIVVALLIGLGLAIALAIRFTSSGVPAPEGTTSGIGRSLTNESVS